MKLIDLHVHSAASDGSLTPSQVVERAFQKKLTAIALTDHDTTSGIDEALSAASSLPLELIPGIELSCLYMEKEIHILGLYLDHHDPALVKFLSEARKKREQRNLLILDAFQKDGFAITWEDLIGHHPDTAVTRAHFARALLKKGYVSSVDQAFRKYLNPECPYYRPRKMISPEESLNAIHAAGGFSVLAHPCLYRLGWEETETLIAYLKELGMNGLECWHSSNTAEDAGKGRPGRRKVAYRPGQAGQGAGETGSKEAARAHRKSRPGSPNRGVVLRPQQNPSGGTGKCGRGGSP